MTMQKAKRLPNATARQQSRRRHIAATVAVVCCLTMSGCSSWIKAGTLRMRPFTGFENVAPGSRVHVEGTASEPTRALARQLQQAYAAAQTTIERTHGASLAAPDVYVCAGEACYARYVMIPDSSAETGQGGHTVVLNAVRLLNKDSGVPIFTHELSHIFWYQHGQRCAPRWWLEGMAVATSGGGAESVGEAQARQFLLDGQVFRPVLDNGCFRPAGRGTLSWAMYYRQSAMFVAYLGKDAPRFAQALQRMRQGDSVGTAVQTAYGQPVAALWEQWRKDETAPPR